MAMPGRRSPFSALRPAWGEILRKGLFNLPKKAVWSNGGEQSRAHATSPFPERKHYNVIEYEISEEHSDEQNVRHRE
jgi:hypothetical protein